MPRVARWKKPTHKPVKTPEVKLNAPLEEYPSVCAGCGKKATRVGGCIERFVNGGECKRFHNVRCMP